MLMNPYESCLIIIDLQEKLLPVLSDPDSIVDRVSLILDGTSNLEVPVIVTEQYADGLGPTVRVLASKCPGSDPVHKTTFCAMDAPSFRSRIDELGGRRLVICGAEAHVCVLQTAVGLSVAGYPVTLVGDAVGSRRESDRVAALGRARDHGVDIVTSEMVLFEWIRRSDSAAFRALLPSIKGDKPDSATYRSI